MRVICLGVFWVLALAGVFGVFVTVINAESESQSFRFWEPLQLLGIAFIGILLVVSQPDQR